MAKRSSSNQLGAAVLFLWLLTVAALIVSVVVIATDNVHVTPEAELRFKDVHAYRYVLAVGVIGLAYSLFQVLNSASHVRRGDHLVREEQGREFLRFLNIVIALLLATGAGVGLGLTVEEKNNAGAFNDPLNKFLDRAIISSSFLLLASICIGLIIFIQEKI